MLSFSHLFKSGGSEYRRKWELQGRANGIRQSVYGVIEKQHVLVLILVKSEDKVFENRFKVRDEFRASVLL